MLYKKRYIEVARRGLFYRRRYQSCLAKGVKNPLWNPQKKEGDAMQATGQERKKPSEQRQKNRIANFRVTADEYRQIESNAERGGLTFGSYLRTRALTSPTTRAMRRPMMEKVIMSKLVAGLGRSGSNLNQIARAMNSGETVLIDQIQSALAEHRQILAAVIETLGRQPR